MEDKHTGIWVWDSIEMHLFYDCEGLVSMQRKLLSDVIDWMQTNLALDKLLFGKLSEIFEDSASALTSLNCFDFSVCCYIQLAWELFCCNCYHPLQKHTPKFPWLSLPLQIL